AAGRAVRPGRQAVRRPRPACALRRPGPRPGHQSAGAVPTRRRRRGSPPPLSRTPLAVAGELQRAVQGDLRVPRPGADPRPGPDPALRPRRPAPLPPRPAAPPRGRRRPARRPQTLPPGRLMLYDQASGSWRLPGDYLSAMFGTTFRDVVVARSCQGLTPRPI